MEDNGGPAIFFSNGSQPRESRFSAGDLAILTTNQWNQYILNTTRSKRWNGKIETLASDYLADVITQMETYGDRVQFAINGPGQRPNYQVTNTN